jgi:hypothetical protein
MKHLLLILSLSLGCGHSPEFSPHRTLALSSQEVVVQQSVMGGVPVPPVERVVVAAPDSARAHFVARMADGDLAGALQAWEAAAGVEAPQAAAAMSAAFSVANQRAGPCIRVAQTLWEGFKSLGFKPEFIRFTPAATSTLNILGWEVRPGVATSTIQISNNGVHFAVRVGDRIYDAFTGPRGMVLSKYLERLTAHGGKPVMSVVESLP